MLLPLLLWCSSSVPLMMAVIKRRVGGGVEQTSDMMSYLSFQGHQKMWMVLAQLRWRCNWWWGLGLVVRIIFPSTPSIKCKIVFILASVIFRIYCYPGPNNGTICHKNKNTALFIYFNSDLAQTSWSHPVPWALSPVAKLLSFARADRTRLFEWGWQRR